MLNSGTSVDKDTLIEAVRTYQSQLQAGLLPAQFADDYEDLTFANLAEAAQAASEAVVKNKKDLLARLKLTHAVALLRDALYSHASSRFVRGMGENNNMRSIYERAVAVLNSTPISSNEGT